MPANSEMSRDTPDVVVVDTRRVDVGSTPGSLHRRKPHWKTEPGKRLGAATVQEVSGRVDYTRKEIRCWFCRESGHLKRSCPQKIRRDKFRKTQPRPPRCRRSRLGISRNNDNEGLLLPVPISLWAENCHLKRRTIKVFPVLTQETEHSCEAVVGGLAMKALTDTGMSVSLLREEYRRLKNRW